MSQHAAFCLCRRRRHGGFPVISVGSHDDCDPSVIFKPACIIICSCLLILIFAYRRALVAFGGAHARAVTLR